MKPDTILGEWVIVAPCGHGNSGTVFKVRHIRDPNRIAALKLCHFSRGSKAKRFCREAENARLVAKLVPGRVPRYICAGRWHGKPYFVMSYSDDLPEHLTKAESVRIVCEVIRTCSTLLSFGLLHGDIKWENVGIEDGRIVLRDFGTLRTVKDAILRPALLGTRYCRAPETDYDGTCDERTEVHALGALFFSLAPLGTRVTYTLPILLAISPFPFLRIRTFAELLDRIERAPRLHRRRIALAAGIWKTKIAFKWISITVGTILLTLLALFFASEFMDSKVRKENYRKRHPELLMKERIWEGFADYRSGDMIGANSNLQFGIRSPHFSQEHFPFDVLELYQDTSRRLATGRR